MGHRVNQTQVLPSCSTEASESRLNLFILLQGPAGTPPLTGESLASSAPIPNVPLVWCTPSPCPGAFQGTTTHNPWTLKRSSQALAASLHVGAQQVQSELLLGNKNLGHSSHLPCLETKEPSGSSIYVLGTWLRLLCAGFRSS